MSIRLAFVVIVSFIDVVFSQDCSNYTTLESALKGASHENTSTSNSSACDNGLNNATWYRYTGEFQQIKLVNNNKTCIDTYHCNAKQTYALDLSSRKNVSDKEYTLAVQYGIVNNCINAQSFFANIYECDTFLLYNIHGFGGPGSPPSDCMYSGQYEPAGFCLEDTVKLLILTTELRHTYKLDKSNSGPLKLNANATRSPTPPLISWFGGDKNLTIAREGFKDTIFNMWSEINVPNNAEYRNVSYCVDSTCGTFNLYTVDMDGVIQKGKVAYINATVKSTIAAVAISWQVGIHNYSSSESGVVVNDGVLKDGIQMASLTIYKSLDSLKDAKITLAINDSSTTTTVNLKSIALCNNNTYFSDGSCKQCPPNTTSPEGSLTSEDCIINRKPSLLIPLLIIGVTCLLLILIITIAVVIYRRRKVADKRTLNFSVNNYT